jgi:cytochrome c oxidase cbb3-type subunit I
VAIVFSIGMAVPVVAGSGNFLLTMRGDWGGVRSSYALPFILACVLLYFFGSMQGTLETSRSLNTIWHLTDFTVSHSHLTMYGFVTFLNWGAIYGVVRSPPASVRPDRDSSPWGASANRQ